MKLFVAAVLAFVSMLSTFGAAQTSIDRGTTVLIRDSQDRLFVRSIVAVSGDVVTVTDGVVIVNGATIPFAVTRGTEWGPQRVAEGQVFVAGNPLQLSADPAAWGLVQSDMVVGTVQPRVR